MNWQQKEVNPTNMCLLPKQGMGGVAQVRPSENTDEKSIHTTAN